MGIPVKALSLLGLAFLSGCRTQDVVSTGETAAARTSPVPRGHSLEFYTRNLAVFVDGVRVDALAKVPKEDVDTVFVFKGRRAVEKYGEWARGKIIFEYVLTSEARERRKKSNSPTDTIAA